MRLVGTAIVILLGAGSMAHAQVSCQKIGAQTYCSNGQVFQRFGNTIHDGQGHVWQQSGDRSYSSDGTTYQRSGSQIFDSKGNSLQRFGNQTYGSDGTVYQKSGNDANVSQRLGNQKRGTSGTFCHPIGDEIFCDPAPAERQPDRRIRPTGGGG